LSRKLKVEEKSKIKKMNEDLELMKSQPPSNIQPFKVMINHPQNELQKDWVFREPQKIQEIDFPEKVVFN
jgi:hypothetical protein